MDDRAQKTSDSNSSLARTESKTARAAASTRSASKSSSMIKRMSKSFGAGSAVTKLPQMKARRSFPFVAASSKSAKRRLVSHTLLGDELPNRSFELEPTVPNESDVLCPSSPRRKSATLPARPRDSSSDRESRKMARGDWQTLDKQFSLARAEPRNQTPGQPVQFVFFGKSRGEHHVLSCGAHRPVNFSQFEETQDGGRSIRLNTNGAIYVGALIKDAVLRHQPAAADVTNVLGWIAFHQHEIG